MFKLTPSAPNTRLFNIKSSYSGDETFHYTMELTNHITKTGITLSLTDISPWVSGVTNQSTMTLGDKVIFNPSQSHYTNAFSEKTFIYNNTIQISGVDYTFDSSTGVTYTNSTKVGSNYIICYNDNGGHLTVVDSGGTVVSTDIFCSNPVSDVQVVDVDSDSIVVGYYDTVLGFSFIREVNVTSMTMYAPYMFYEGVSDNLKMCKISATEFSISYSTPKQGIIRIFSLLADHSIVYGYPTVFNDDVTLYSNSVYQNNNIVVLYYDIDDQVKIKNCTIYNGDIYTGEVVIVSHTYASDLNIEKLDDKYVYITLYNDEFMEAQSYLVYVGDTLVVLDQYIPLIDWTEGLTLTIITDKQFMLSYMDGNYYGVYNLVDINSVNLDEIKVQYQLFNIDLTYKDVTKLIGHNDYTIKYNNIVVEEGQCFIEYPELTYNI